MKINEQEEQRKPINVLTDIKMAFTNCSSISGSTVALAAVNLSIFHWQKVGSQKACTVFRTSHSLYIPLQAGKSKEVSQMKT